MHPTNGRYVTDDTLVPIVLVGSSTWANNQDYNGISQYYPSTIPRFDYEAYLDTLQTHGHNFIRLWTWQYTAGPEGATDYLKEPDVWLRTGPGNAFDGLLKFDLTQFNQPYFDGLRSKCIAAGNRGMMVGVMLFIKSASDTISHPFNLANNINGLDIGSDQEEYHSLNQPAITARQEAYVEKVIDTINDLDNVFYEIGNELLKSGLAFSEHFIDHIRTYELTKPKQHLVWMSPSGGFGTGDPNRILVSDVMATAADLAGVRTEEEVGNTYADDPPATDGVKVMVSDTDHILGVLGTTDITIVVNWAWKSICRGLGSLVYLDVIQLWLPSHDPATTWNDPNNVAHLPARRAIGDARRYAQRLDLASATPQDNLSSTLYCLADPGNGYLVYQEGTGQFSLDMVAGAYFYEWYDPFARIVVDAGQAVVATETVNWTPPFSGEAVLYLNTQETSMANEDYIRFGTPVVWTDSGGDEVLDLGGLGANAVRVGSFHDWGIDPRPDGYLLEIDIDGFASAPTAGQQVAVYLSESQDGTTFSGPESPADASDGVGNVGRLPNLKGPYPVYAWSTTAGDNLTKIYSINSASRYVSPVVHNLVGNPNLLSSGDNHTVTITPYYRQLQ